MKSIIFPVVITLFTANVNAFTIERETDPGECGHSVYGKCDNRDNFTAHSNYDDGYWKLALNGGVYSLKSENLGDYEKAIKIICGENPYTVGDRVYVHFQNGRKCPAAVIISGKEQNKIEYNDYCENLFISSKQKDEQEWAPNSSLSIR